jgi:hypothetical protein
LTRSVAFIAVSIGLAGCGSNIAKSSTSQSQLAPADALQCVLNQFEQIGYQRTMYDKGEFRASGRKVNPKITFSNVQFRKTWDRLDVEIAPGTGGTDLKVTPSTAAEYFGQTGTFYNQLKTSDAAVAAAKGVEQACHAGQPPTSAPQPPAPAPQPATPAPQPAPTPQPAAPAPQPPAQTPQPPPPLQP